MSVRQLALRSFLFVCDWFNTNRSLAEAPMTDLG